MVHARAHVFIHMHTHTLHNPGGNAKRLTAVYNGKRWHAAVKMARYHSIPHGILPFHTQYRLNTACDYRGNSKLAVQVRPGINYTSDLTVATPSAAPRVETVS